MFPRELKAGEYDVISCVPDGRIVVHDCRMHADCRNLFINHHAFQYDGVYDQHTDSDQVYEDAVKAMVPLVVSSARYATVLMYGQTGSGKTFTMQVIRQIA